MKDKPFTLVLVTESRYNGTVLMHVRQIIEKLAGQFFGKDSRKQLDTYIHLGCSYLFRF
ncbi:MAG: hypothetical protein ACJAXF_003233 [Polaribacter sp.]|jgi:hypothetical protein